MKKLTIFVLALLLSVALLPVTAKAETASGECGPNATWTLSSGVLTISGTGEMTSSPWRSDYSKAIKRVVIKDGITKTSYDAFAGCTGITTVEIADSVVTIQSDTFRGCTGLITRSSAAAFSSREKRSLFVTSR